MSEKIDDILNLENKPIKSALSTFYFIKNSLGLEFYYTTVNETLNASKQSYFF